MGFQAVIGRTDFFGAAEGGGSWGYGTVFHLAFSPPVLEMIPDGSNVLLQWPVSPGDFRLETTTSPAAPAIWTTNTLAPILVNGYYAVTNPTIDSQRFFRLKLQ